MAVVVSVVRHLAVVQRVRRRELDTRFEALRSESMNYIVEALQ